MSTLRAEIVAEMQRFMALVIYKKRGASLSFASLAEYAGVFRTMAHYCEMHRIAFDAFWQSSDRLSDFCFTLKSRAALTQTARVMATLMAMDPDADIGFPLGCSSLFAALQERVSQFPARNQTPPMPTRVYSAVLTTLNAELNDFEEVADRYLALVRRIVALRAIPRGERDSLYDMSPLIAEYTLSEYFAKKGLAITVPGVSSGLSDIQAVCRLTIHAYSGMRHSEAQTLPFNCLSADKGTGITHYFLEGRTTKLEKGRIRRTKWVTSSEGARAVNMAQKIAIAIYEAIGDAPAASKDRINVYPLFISTSYLRFSGTPSYQAVQDTYQTSDSRLSSPPYERLALRLCPIIGDEDVCELEEIDPHRAWRNDSEYGVGQAWTLRTHQFRRSLALYAQRSGLVSLPSLRRQLQHITREMSLYYSNGSVFARNFIEDDPDEYREHMCKDWREAKPVSEAMAFLRDVVFSDERLFGAAGTFEQQKKNRGQVVDREMTVKQFKKGLIAYKETPFGGCLKIGECDQVGLRLMGVLCLHDCKNIVIKLSKLDRIIDQQQRLVESLEPSSPTYRMEKDDLDTMLAARKRCRETTEKEADHG